MKQITPITVKDIMAYAANKFGETVKAAEYYNFVNGEIDIDTGPYWRDWLNEFEPMEG